MTAAMKTQPWKAFWPPPENAKKGVEVGKKAGEILEIDGTGGNGNFGYNDKGEGIVPAAGSNVRPS
jgi:hypothetical protein